MPKTTKKLTLKQETLRNLMAEELHGIVGGFCPSNCTCSNGTVCYSCVECPPPPPDMV
jgi:hypothetical protein